LKIYILNPKSNGDETDMVYDFDFLTEKEAKSSGDDVFWLKVGDILNLKEQFEVNDYLIGHGLMQRPLEQAKFANKMLFRLWEVIHQTKVINYYLENDESLNKVLNIFIRVDSGGTILSYSDLLLSVATAQWKNKDAREEITSLVDELDNIGDGFKFDEDVIIKGSLVLADINNIAFKADNFNKENMSKIEEQWEQIEKAFRGAVLLAATFGYNRDTLTSNYAIIPIAYYLKKLGLPENFYISSKYKNDREAICRWLVCLLIKRVFGGSPDMVLRQIREVLSKANGSFQYEEIVEKFKGTPKSLVFTEDDIESLLNYKWGNEYTFSILALMYPTLDFRNKFHIDHAHPRSKFKIPELRQAGIQEADQEFYLKNMDLLPNLKLLEGIPNEEKSDTYFADWFEKNFKKEEKKEVYRKRHYIPNIDLSFFNFEEFFKELRDLLRQELCRVLVVPVQKQE